MRYLSLFSGIGGFELGIQQAYENTKIRLIQQEISRSEHSGNIESGWRHTEPDCVGYSEIDKYAIQTYQRHFPEHHNYGDITKIKPEELPNFDLVVGGFPCQAFSIAGKRGGFSDTRGTLFFDIARILSIKRPRLVLLENVKGLLSHDEGRTFRTIITALDELGYDCQWQVLNAKDFGVPQNRERVFIVGHLRGTRRPEVFPFGEANTKYAECKINEITKNRNQRKRIYSSDGIMATLNGADGKGGGREPKILIGTLRTHNDGNGFRETKSGLAPTIPARAREDGSGQPIVFVPEATKKGYAEARVGQAINLAVPGSTTRRGRVSNLAQTLDTGMQQHTLTEEARIRRLTPVECERLMGLPDGWTEGVSDTQRYKMCGNGVVTNVVAAVVERLINSTP